MTNPTVYFLLDPDGYPVKSSLEPFDGAQEEPASAVAERAQQYHHAGKPARFIDDAPGAPPGGPGGPGDRGRGPQ